MLRAVTGIFVLWMTGFATAHAATIQSVSPDGTTLHVKLSRDELATMPWRGKTLVELSDLKEVFVAPMEIRELVPAKSTLVLVSDEPLTQAKRLMSIRLLSLFWDPLPSPLLLSPAQLHSFPKLTLGGSAGAVYEALGQRRSDRERRRLSRGAMLRMDAVVPTRSEWPGLTFGLEHLSAQQDLTISSAADTAGSETTVTQTMTLAKNVVRTGAWSPVGSDLRLGLRIDYTRLETVAEGSGRKDLFTYEIVEPNVSLTYFDPQFEGTLSFKWGGKSKSTSSSPVNGSMSTVTSTIRTPSELWFGVRSPTRHLGLWGAGLGYLFYHWETQVDDALMPKVTLPELLRGRLSWEERLNQGHKVTMILQYDGGKSPNPWLTERLANTMSLIAQHQILWRDTWTFGSQLRLEFGSTKFAQKVPDGSGKLVARDDKISSLGTEILIYAQRPLDTTTH